MSTATDPTSRRRPSYSSSFISSSIYPPPRPHPLPQSEKSKSGGGISSIYPTAHPASGPIPYNLSQRLRNMLSRPNNVLVNLWTHHPRLLVCVIGSVVSIFLFLTTSSSSSKSSNTFIWPGLLPSRYPPPIAHIAPEPIPPTPSLQSTLDNIYDKFVTVYSQHCSSPPPKPIYTSPQLTPAQRKRYAHLQKPQLPISHKIKHKNKPAQGRYMFTTLTREISSQLPDLLNALFLITTYLGPEHVSFSILEGPSSDPTPYVLRQVLQPLLESIGVPRDRIRIDTDEPKIDFDTVNRIDRLAELRNKALEPLWKDDDKDYIEATKDTGRKVGRDVVAVVFFNDVFLRPVDFLEVLHQHVKAGSRGITTGWDWMSRDPDHFYDVWVARTIDSGDLFYPINWPWWSPSTDLFTTSPQSKTSYTNLQPFQAFSSWNGLAVLSPEPFFGPYNIRFRRGDNEKGECAASECTLIASDFWKVGYGQIQVVPSVQLAYDRETAEKSASILRDQQYELKWVDGVPPKSLDTTVEWVMTPPEKVRCHPWPETNGLNANVWATTEWVPPFLE